MENRWEYIHWVVEFEFLSRLFLLVIQGRRFKVDIPRRRRRIPFGMISL